MESELYAWAVVNCNMAEEFTRAIISWITPENHHILQKKKVNCRKLVILVYSPLYKSRTKFIYNKTLQVLRHNTRVIEKSLRDRQSSQIGNDWKGSYVSLAVKTKEFNWSAEDLFMRASIFVQLALSDSSAHKGWIWCSLRERVLVKSLSPIASSPSLAISINRSRERSRKRKANWTWWQLILVHNSEYRQWRSASMSRPELQRSSNINHHQLIGQDFVKQEEVSWKSCTIFRVANER